MKLPTRRNHNLASLVGLWGFTVLTLLAAQPALAQPASAQATLESAIDRVLDDEAFATAWWGALVLDLERGDTLYQRNATRNFVPASNTKLYTTAAALNQLGPHYRYRTEMYVDGPIRDGVLYGNLIVRGSGDPVIGGRFNGGDRTHTFRAWADSLHALGITRIAGDLIGDDDVFDDTPLGYGWSWDDETYWYAAEVSGLSFNDNNIDFTIRAQQLGEPAHVGWEPLNTSYVDVVNSTITISADSSLVEGYRRARGTNTIALSSRVPVGRTDLESLTMTNPTRFFVHVLRESLLASGISVAGEPVDVDDLSIKPDYVAPRMQRVAVHFSPPLREIVDVINKRSQNLYAEQVLRTLAAERPVVEKDLTPGSAAMGLDVAMRTFVAAGIDTSRFQLVDGSGLSRMNLVTPQMTGALLRYMWYHPDPDVKSAFYNSLPIGGLEGTLEFRLTSGPVRGNVRAKTGTLSNASALSGYITAADETPLAFVLMANHYTVPSRAVRAAQDRIAALLADFQR